jgi:putative ABC transport system permease protein
MNERVVEKMQDREGWTTFFALGFDDHAPEAIDKRLGELQERFKKFQVGSDSAYREVRGAKEQSRILALALGAMSLLIGAMGALGVLNTLTLNVLERRREIGVLRSIGAGDANIAQIFLTEGIALGLGGWVVGLLAGYPLGMAFVNLMGATLFKMDYIFSPGMVAVSFVFAMVLAVAASIAPAIGAARMRVGEALRYE